MTKESVSNLISEQSINSNDAVGAYAEIDYSYDEIIEKLISIWKEVLEIDDVNANESFFELGGNSIKAIALEVKLYKELSVEISLEDIFHSITIEQLAERILNLKKSDYIPIGKAEKKEYYPLAPFQKRILLLSQMSEVGTSYNMTYTCIIEGNVDIRLLDASFKNVVRRHNALRLCVKPFHGDYVQFIRDASLYSLDYIECSKDELSTRIKNIVKPFDIFNEPLVRATLIKIQENKYIFIFDIHHIICDGFSFNVLLEEIFNMYNGHELADIEYQFTDYIDWQAEKDSMEAMEKREKYWLDEFSGSIPLLNMPVDFQRTGYKSSDGDVYSCILDGELTENLQKFAGQNNVTLFMVLLGIYGLLLSKYTGQDDIVIGTIFATRTQPELEGIVGPIVENIALRIPVKGNISFSEYLQIIKHKVTKAFANQPYPIELLTDKLNIKHDTGRTTLYDTMLIFENFKENYARRNNLSLNNVVVKPYISEHTTATSDITIYASLVEHGMLTLNAEYCTKLFKKETIARFMEHFKNIANNILKVQDPKLRDIGMLSDDERKILLYGFNNTKVQYPTNKGIKELFEEQARIKPDNIAVVYNDSSLTYKELNSMANQLARKLKDMGVGRDSLVGILADRSVYMCVGVLSVIKAGGVYVPIDTGYPPDRIEHILTDSQCKIILTHGHISPNIAEHAFKIDIEDSSLYMGDDSNLDLKYNPDSTAYIIYTSGSTGKPKGAMIAHKSLTNAAYMWRDVYKLDKFEVCLLQIASIAFDVFTGDFVRALTNGGKMVICPNEIKYNIPALYQLIKRNGINVIEATPTIALPLMDYVYAENMDIGSLKLLIVGADSFPIEEYKKLVKRYGNVMRIVNSYGVTEATIDSSFYEETAENVSTYGSTPIGKPLPNTQYYVLNDNLELQPIGVVGGLFIGGIGVGQGYYRNEDLTKARFIKNPFNSDEIIYNTGDIVRWLPDGNIEYVGRSDDQVKIRGYRIELGEVENQILKSNLVDEVVVVAGKDTGGISYLSAYIVTGQDLTLDMLRSNLSVRLPEYMIPTYFIKLDKIPRTPNGKINRKALPAPDESNLIKTEYSEPCNEIERKLVRIWREVLNTGNIGVNDSFLSLGGHSLKAINLATRIYKEFKTEILIGDIYKLLTIKRMAEFIMESDKIEYPEMKISEKSGHYPLSTTQKGIFFLNQSNNTNTAFNIPYIRIIEGPIDIIQLENCFNELIERHEPLRTSFEIIDGEPAQIVHDNIEFKIDFKYIKAENAHNEIESFIKPFDIGKAPLFRVGLYSADRDRHIFLMDIHHIIADGSSINILIKQISDLYNGKPIKSSKLQYKDYAVWQNELVKSGYFLAKQNYWFDKLSGDISILNLPYDNMKTVDTQYMGKSIDTELSSDMCKRLEIISNNKKVTLHSLLFSAFSLMLSRYSGQDDVIVGSISAGRKTYEMQDMVGAFINVIPIRIKIDPDSKYSELAVKTHEAIIGANDNQEYTINEIVRNLPNLPDGMRYSYNSQYSSNPLFNTMFIFHSYIDSGFNLQLNNTVCKAVGDVKNDSNQDIVLEVAATQNNTMFCKFEYNSALFEEETIRRMQESFILILEQATNDPDLRVSSIDILSKAEKAKLLYEFNSNKVDYSCYKPLHVLFEEQAVRVPERIAIKSRDEQITYNELNEASNQLARYLKKQGIQKEDIVAILLERTPDTVKSILAVWKAGAAYLPIDPNFPGNRISGLIKDSGAKLIITKSKYINKEWAAEYHNKIIEIDKCSLSISAESSTNLDETINMNELAYVLYTSGSTGIPKGVMIEHLGMMNHIKMMISELNITEATCIAQNAPFCFDISVWQLVTALAVGAKSVIYPEDTIMNPKMFIESIINDEISILEVVPSYLSIMLDYLEKSNFDFKSLRYLIVTGEAMKLNLAQRWFSLVKGIKMVNAYGPAEASDDVTFFYMDSYKKGDKVLIGKPLQNINIYIVDKNMNLCPIGVNGEICVSGISVGRGYLNDPERTERAFVKDPFAEDRDCRLYKTGDIGRWLHDGNIEYIGRADHQIKVNGFRIELGEIENIMVQYGSISIAAVIDKENVRGERCICAYYTSDKKIDGYNLKKYLSERLPDYMVPTYYEQLQEMPLLPNGKIDRKSLRLSEIKPMEESTVHMPQDEFQLRLRKIWTEILNTDITNIDDNFFMLGGNSLKAILLTSKIQQEFGNEVPISIIFKSPTIRGISDYIKRSMQKELPPIEISPQKELYDISSAQKRVYLSSKLMEDGVHYNIPLMYKIEGYLDLDKVENAINKLIKRHEALQTYFIEKDNKIYQGIDRNASVKLQVWHAENGDEAAIEKIKSRFVSPFDLRKAPLFRVGIIVIAETEYLLLTDIHHIISDAQSNLILLKELISIYSNRNLLPVKVQYKDYAVWHNKLIESNYFSKQEEYWKGIFMKDIPLLNMPLDFERPRIRTFKGDKVYSAIDEELSTKLENLSLHHGVTNYMLLFAAYNVLTACYACQEDIVIGTPIVGRTHPDIENTVGMFVNTLAIRSYPERNKSFLYYLNELKKILIDSYENQEYQFDMLVEKLKLPRRPNRNPLFDLVFAYFDTSDNQISVEEFAITEFPSNAGVSKFDMSLYVIKDSKRIILELEYCTELFKMETAEMFLNHYIKVLNAISDDVNIKIGDIELEYYEHDDSDIEDIVFSFD